MASSSRAAGRTWDVVSLGTVAVLGVLGVRRRHAADGANPPLSPSTADRDNFDLSGAQCIVTGASSGIGAEVAWGLARAGADKVQMACRDLGRCERKRADKLTQCLAARPSDEAEVAGLSPAEAASLRAKKRRKCALLHQTCICAHLELTDPDSVRTFAGSFSGSSGSQRISSSLSDGHLGLPRLVLVNNAAVICDSRDGVDSAGSGNMVQWANHFGHFLLTSLLLPIMGPGSCVIIVACQSHRWGSLKIQRDAGDEICSDAIEHSHGNMGSFSGPLSSLGLAWYARYARSKLCNVLFAAELRKRYPDGPVCLAVSPGRMDTRLYEGAPGWFHRPLTLLARACFHTPDEGAAHILAAMAEAETGRRRSIAAAAAADVSSKASTEEESSPPPLYWHCGRPQRPSAASEDPLLGAALWRASEAACKL